MNTYQVSANGTYWGDFSAPTAQEAIQIAVDEIGTDGNTDGVVAVLSAPVSIDTDFGPLRLQFDPTAHQTKEGAAKALYEALCGLCKEMGGDPSYIWIKSPAESEAHGYVGARWHVCWEDGPYDWACGAFVTGPWGYCETYWGFDLIFVD